METSPPAAGRSGGDSNATNTQIQESTSKSNNSNICKGQGQGCCGGRGGYQWCGGRIGRFIRTAHTSLVIKFKGEVEDFDMILGTTAKQREAKYQFNKFSEKMKQYALQEFKNPEYIIILVLYVKYPITEINTSGPTLLSTDEEKDPKMVMIQTEEIKKYAKKSTLQQNTIKLYGMIWGNLPSALQSEL